MGRGGGEGEVGSAMKMISDDVLLLQLRPHFRLFEKAINMAETIKEKPTKTVHVFISLIVILIITESTPFLRKIFASAFFQ